MTDRDWFSRFESEARAANDEQRLRLVGLIYEADMHRETNPDRMLALLDEGRHLARQLREPWWTLFYDDRRAGALMKYKGDAQAGLELAVRNALEARKPLYESFPWRFRIHDHLIVGYLNTDPVGYASEIHEALTWLERDVPAEGSPKYLLLARRRWLAGELGQHDEAEELARRALAVAASDTDQLTARSHSVFCFSHLCEIAYRRCDWPALGEQAAAGEELARQVGHQLELSEFQMWQALLARRGGHEPAATRLWRLARRRVGQLGMPPDHIYFDALCAYHESAGELAEAFSVREHEARLLENKGRWAAESRCRIERCRLLARLGRPLHDELAKANAAARRLRYPAAALEELALLQADKETTRQPDKEKESGNQAVG
jgi:hypothetical protein